MPNIVWGLVVQYRVHMNLLNSVDALPSYFFKIRFWYSFLISQFLQMVSPSLLTKAQYMYTCNIDRIRRMAYNRRKEKRTVRSVQHFLQTVCWTEAAVRGAGKLRLSSVFGMEYHGE
jgi:hypothetical protein